MATAEDIRWATDHQAQIVRNFEFKSQVFIGVILLFLPTSADQFPVLTAFGLWSDFAFALFGIAVFFHLRVILEVRSAHVREVGATPYFLTKRIAAADYLPELNSAKLDDLGKELLKLQLIRQHKSARFSAASAVTLVAFSYLAIALAINAWGENADAFIRVFFAR